MAKMGRLIFFALEINQKTENCQGKNLFRFKISHFKLVFDTQFYIIFAVHQNSGIYSTVSITRPDHSRLLEFEK